MNGTVLSFYLFGRYLGIDITKVKEMNRNIEYTIVPGASPDLVGLLNLRGQIVSLLDLVYLMEGTEKKPPADKETGQAEACIILKARAGDAYQIGFLIDEPGEVLELTNEICEPPPANLGGMDSSLVKEVARLEDELLIIPDIEKLQIMCMG